MNSFLTTVKYSNYSHVSYQLHNMYVTQHEKTGLRVVLGGIKNHCHGYCVKLNTVIMVLYYNEHLHNKK